MFLQCSPHSAYIAKMLISLCFSPMQVHVQYSPSWILVFCKRRFIAFGYLSDTNDQLYQFLASWELVAITLRKWRKNIYPFFKFFLMFQWPSNKKKNSSWHPQPMCLISICALCSQSTFEPPVHPVTEYNIVLFIKKRIIQCHLVSICHTSKFVEFS